jgi:hypothetical protein
MLLLDTADQSQKLVYEDKQLKRAWLTWGQRGHFGADSALGHHLTHREHGVKALCAKGRGRMRIEGDPAGSR